MSSNENGGADLNRELTTAMRVDSSTHRKVRRLKAGRTEKGFVIAATVIAAGESVFDGNVRIAIAIAISSVVVAVWLYWIATFVRSALRTEVDISPKSPRSFPPLTYIWAPLVLILAGLQLLAAEIGSAPTDQFADVTGRVLITVSIVLSASFTYMINPLLEHLKRPFDSIESRAERDAAALTFLLVMFLLGVLTLGSFFFMPDRIDTGILRIASGLALCVLLGVYYETKELLIRKRS